MQKGFTLLEIIVVIGVLAVVGVIIVTIFTRTLRGNNKAEILVAIKQNGQSVLENMTQVIRNADNVACPLAGTTSDTLAVVQNGSYQRYRFLPANNTNTAKGSCLSANGCIIKDQPVQPSTGLESDLTLFINNLCTDPPTSPQIITDTNPQSGVSAENGSFKVTTQSGSKPAVTVKFDLLPAKNSLQAVAQTIDAVNFETTIQLR